MKPRELDALVSAALPKPDGRHSRRVARALEFYARLYAPTPAHFAALHPADLSPAAIRRRRRLGALLDLELECMTRLELANYYAEVRKL